MSARSAIERPLVDVLPGTTATIPVRPMPLWCSMPSAAN